MTQDASCSCHWLETEEIHENVKQKPRSKTKDYLNQDQKQDQLKRRPKTKYNKTESEITKMKKSTAVLPVLFNDFRSRKENGHITESIKPPAALNVRRGRKYPDKDKRREEQTKNYNSRQF